MPSKIFVYKTLLNNKNLKSVLGHTPKKKKIVLRGYSEKDKGKGYHTIESNSKGSVHGAVISVSKKDLNKLDDWENHYSRFKVSPGTWTYKLKDKQMNKQAALEQIKQAAFEDELEKMSGFNSALKGLGHSTKNSDRLSYQDDLEPVELNMALEDETGKSIPDKIFFKAKTVGDLRKIYNRYK